MANFCTNCGSKLAEGSTKCAMCNQIVEGTVSSENVIGKITKQINKLAGGKGSVHFKIGDLFTNVFKKHTVEDASEIFTCGTKLSTPNDNEISSSWPKPWLYARVCLMFAITFLLLQLCVTQFGNKNALPGMMFIGAIMVPFALLIFFIEVNAPRNISFYEIAKIFFIGGGASLFVTLFLYSISEGSTSKYLNAILIGIIEEIGKAAIVVYCIAKRPNTKYVLNGLLIGAAVGAGFATFETAGYIFVNLFNSGYDGMMKTIYLRAFLAPGGHVAWAAINGAALMLVKRNRQFNSSMLLEKRFISFFAITVVLHAIWDMPIYFGEEICLIQDILVIAAWIVILVLIQVGLKQIDNKEFFSYTTPQYLPQLNR